MQGYAAHDKSYAAGNGNGYAVRDNTVIAECAAVQHEHIQDSKIMALAAVTVTLYATRNAGWGTLRAADRGMGYAVRDMYAALACKGSAAGNGKTACHVMG